MTCSVAEVGSPIIFDLGDANEAAPPHGRQPQIGLGLVFMREGFTYEDTERLRPGDCKLKKGFHDVIIISQE